SGGTCLPGLEWNKLGINLYDGESESGHQYDLAWYMLPRGYSLPAIYTVEDYSAANSVIRSEEYTYEPEGVISHFKPVKSKVTKSDGTAEVTHTIFPNDYTDTSGPIGDMKSNYLIGIPVEQVTYKQAGSQYSVVSGVITTFKAGGQGLPDKSFVWESASPIASSSFKFSNRNMGQIPPAGAATAYNPDSRYRSHISYDTYDEKGNLLQFTAKDGIVTSLIWGYKGAYPLAHITNATAASVNNAISAAGTSRTSLSNETNAGTILNYLNQIRNNSNISSALMSSYTYKPLVGMTSFTDASGKQTWYNYDSFGRLSNIRENSSAGNLIQSFTYKYAGGSVSGTNVNTSVTVSSPSDPTLSGGGGCTPPSAPSITKT